MDALLTVAETPEYLRRAERLLSSTERAGVIEYLAANPRTGDLIRGTAGVRVIYYFHSDAMPLYLLTVFGKNEKADLSGAERNELAALVRILKAAVETK
jgi:hypothetical protein